MTNKNKNTHSQKAIVFSFSGRHVPDVRNDKTVGPVLRQKETQSPLHVLELFQNSGVFTHLELFEVPSNVSTGHATSVTTRHHHGLLVVMTLARHEDKVPNHLEHAHRGQRYRRVVVVFATNTTTNTTPRHTLSHRHDKVVQTLVQPHHVVVYRVRRFEQLSIATAFETH